MKLTLIMIPTDGDENGGIDGAGWVGEVTIGYSVSRRNEEMNNFTLGGLVQCKRAQAQVNPRTS